MKHNKPGTKIARAAVNGAIGKRGRVHLYLDGNHKYRLVVDKNLVNGAIVKLI